MVILHFFFPLFTLIGGVVLVLAVAARDRRVLDGQRLGDGGQQRQRQKRSHCGVLLARFHDKIGEYSTNGWTMRGTTKLSDDEVDQRPLSLLQFETSELIKAAAALR